MEMNKYALGTIFGTSILGLIKSRAGSNIRLRIKEETVWVYTANIWLYDYDQSLDNSVETARNISAFITTDPILKGLSVDVVSYEDYDYDGDGEWATQYVLKVTIEAQSAVEDEAIEDRLQILMDILERRLGSQIGGDDMYSEMNRFSRLETKIINADTGEEYKIPISITPKLRAR